MDSDFIEYFDNQVQIWVHSHGFTVQLIKNNYINVLLQLRLPHTSLIYNTRKDEGNRNAQQLEFKVWTICQMNFVCAHSHPNKDLFVCNRMDLSVSNRMLRMVKIKIKGEFLTFYF